MKQGYKNKEKRREEKEIKERFLHLMDTRVDWLVV